MSFSKTISTIAALASIFGAGAAGWKLSETNSQKIPPTIDNRIEQLEKQLEDTKKQIVVQSTPEPVKLPPEPVVQSPQPVLLPPPELPPVNAY
tara:strand:+ start:861 stop:1139 length:279 start_codon:yes stop_codon:yes gene_type:complete